MKNIINITDGPGKRFPYLVDSTEEYDHWIPNQWALLDTTETGLRVSKDLLILADNPNHDETVYTIYRDLNVWTLGAFSVEARDYDFPEMVRRRTITVMVPDFNPSVYTEQLYYAVDVKTRIGETEIVLNSKIFSSAELLSLPKPFTDNGTQYHQYFRFEILDPWDLCYLDDYKNFRELFCYEAEYTNNCGALIDVEISVVEKEGSDYIPSNRYSSGRNLILLSERDSDYLNLQLSENVDDGVTNYLTKLEFNSAYDGDLKTYFAETYFLDVDYIVPELVVMGPENVYKLIDLDRDYSVGTTAEFPAPHFNGWNEYENGLVLTSTFRLFDHNDVEVMDIRSNSLLLTPSRFAFLVGDAVTIDDIDMEINTLDVVNKIEKKIVSVERPDEYKSNVIKPVFYRAYPTDEIELHPTVSFNIGVDLDNYKSKVDHFNIQIEGQSFPEIGRVPGYVLFRIAGEKLPKDVPVGTYYILDGDGTMVTSGKYSYAQ